MGTNNIIGIVGGVGPYAGIDLAEKIFDETLAESDQEHLPVALLSFPHMIEDRTKYFLRESDINPAYAVYEIISQLESIGAVVVGIPCNTMHIPQIFDVLQELLKRNGSEIHLINMMDSAIDFIDEYFYDLRSIGILSTTGTYKSGIYEEKLKGRGYKPVSVNPDLQDEIHNAIYNPAFGIKAKSSPITTEAKNILLQGVEELQDKGTEAIILGCTEIALALSENKISDIPFLDPTRILGRALIHHSNPDRLRPFSKL